ncbi:MAG: hypothetical protein M1449_03770 [Candidatus Thermoplasmatota archaeon]|nr:hypothetical protein [Candidatus Thermoplasmatota archaeon]
MHDPREWLDAGFRDVSDGQAVSLIEWPEKAAGWLPPPDVIVRLTIADDAREIECEAASPRGAHYLETCCTNCRAKSVSCIARMIPCAAIAIWPTRRRRWHSARNWRGNWRPASPSTSKAISGRARRRWCAGCCARWATAEG